MAKFNSIFGRMRGKLGGVVYYSSNGKQCVRERVIEVANPRSSKQAIQRAIAATVGKFVSAFAPVLNNSLQSEQTKNKTLAKIRSLNMNFLRQLAAQELGTYCPKGAMFVAPNDYIISRGSLRGIEPLRSDSALSEMSRTISGVFNATDIVVNATNTASQAFPGISVGDQITIIVTSHTAIAEGSQVAMCRFAFKDNTTPVFLATEDEGEFLLNPAAIDLTKAAGKFDELVFEPATLEGSAISRIHVGNLLGGVVFLDNFGLIVSREQKKLRSNARMVSVALSDYTLEEVYPTYMYGGTTIDMPSEVYLNNDSQGAATPVVRYSGYATGSAPELPYEFAGLQDRLIVLSSVAAVPVDETPTTLGTIKCTFGGVEYETPIEVDNAGSSVEAHADIEGVSGGLIRLSGLNAQGPQLTLSINLAELAGLTIESINLNW